MMGCSGKNKESKDIPYGEQNDRMDQCYGEHRRITLLFLYASESFTGRFVPTSLRMIMSATPTVQLLHSSNSLIGVAYAESRAG